MFATRKHLFKPARSYICTAARNPRELLLNPISKMVIHNPLNFFTTNIIVSVFKLDNHGQLLEIFNCSFEKPMQKARGPFERPIQVENLFS